MPTLFFDVLFSCVVETAGTGPAAMRRIARVLGSKTRSDAHAELLTSLGEASKKPGFFLLRECMQQTCKVGYIM